MKVGRIKKSFNLKSSRGLKTHTLWKKNSPNAQSLDISFSDY